MVFFKIIRRGLKLIFVINMGFIGKIFDVYEKEMVGDVIKIRIFNKWESIDVFLISYI